MLDIPEDIAFDNIKIYDDENDDDKAELKQMFNKSVERR